MKNFNLSKIKMLVMDVDGTLTDGKIYYGNTGEVFKAFNVKDGFGIISLEKYGIIPVIITGRESEIVTRRGKELNIKEIHQNVEDKLKTLGLLLKKYGFSADEIAYIGDDLNDLSAMKFCGFSACPRDGIKDLTENVDYISTLNGGSGAIREIIDLIIKSKQR